MDYSLLESAPDAMVIIDANGAIVFVNAQSERLFGYQRSELIGRSLETLIPERSRAAHVARRDEYVRERPRTRPMGAGLELHARSKDGREIPVEISLSPLTSAAGVMVVSAIRDISDRKTAEAERTRLVEERAVSAEASRLKDEFLATLSHELRTPLNAILGWTAMLRSGTIPAERREHALATIERNARAQAQLIEDMLDLSRIIAGKLRLDVAAVDLGEILQLAADVVRPGAEAKHIELDVVVEDGPILLMADGDRLQQAVWNLLTNAVKFTGEGGRILVRAQVSPGCVDVVVRDNGKGVAQPFLAHVFDRFRQEDSTSTRTHGGLGLGLAIVRSIAEAHGGTVSAASPGPGRGSTFTITIPHTLGRTRERRGALRQESLVSRLQDVAVMIVDDTSDERELFAEILQAFGAVVTTASSVAMAMALLPRIRPQVIVSDIAMPDEDGFELLRRVRAHGDAELAATPAVAVTAHARAEDRRFALAQGFQRYLSKPVYPIELAETVAAALTHSTP